MLLHLILNAGKENKHMYSTLTLVKKYVQYYITASNGKGHGVHSPFVYSFIQKVLLDKKLTISADAIESVRAQLLKDKTQIQVWDRGAGSRQNDTPTRAINQIAATALKPKKYSQLIHRLVAYFNPINVIEMGTSLGITTAYIAAATKAPVITMEGAPTIAAKAKDNFKKLGFEHIEVVEGDFEHTLPLVVAKLEKVGLAYVDGNHRYEPTIQYFHELLKQASDDTVIIFDDIHWSAAMEKAWDEIKCHPSVTLTIDLFFIGLVFFRKENKEPSHFVIRY